jgi:peptidoglycan/LPS O-acetylase OafA/YrhL
MSTSTVVSSLRDIHQVKMRAPFNYNLEALRGLAASLVVWHHVIVHPRQLDSTYTPVGIAAYNAPGHFAVLIFFLLSGFVIGKSQPEPLQRSGISTYLRKRFIRLYPMYLLAILAGVVASGFNTSLSTVVQHLFFLQGWTTTVIMENNPLWSLQYEVLFYLAFIPLSIYNARPWLVTITCASLGIAMLMLDPTGLGGTISQYLFGFSFWALGWALSSYSNTEVPAASARLISALLLMLSIEYLNPLTTVVNKVLAWGSAHHWTDASIWVTYILNIRDFASLPYAALIVYTMANKLNRRWQPVALVLQLLPLVGLVYAARHWSDPATHDFFIPCLCYGASLALYLLGNSYLQTISQKLVRVLAQVGTYSYGLYVIHFPILVAFHHVPFFTGNPVTFACRAVLYLVLAFAAGYWLDKHFQPWIKKKGWFLF